MEFKKNSLVSIFENYAGISDVNIQTMAYEIKNLVQRGHNDLYSIKERINYRYSSIFNANAIINIP